MPGSSAAPNAEADGDATEEVFVILPEDSGEISSLPVVESEVIEEKSWEGTGPTTTDVLKNVPDASPQGSVALEDVALKKENPLAPPTDTATQQISPPEAASGAAGDERAVEGEIGAIDEIADLAADLERDEATLGSGPSLETAPTAEIDSHKSVPRRHGGRLFAAALALAAAGAGVFFYPQIEEFILGFGGVGSSPTRGNQAHAVVQPKPKDAPDADKIAREAKATARTAFRTKVLLSMQVGLRAEAGKE